MSTKNNEIIPRTGICHYLLSKYYYISNPSPFSINLTLFTCFGHITVSCHHISYSAHKIVPIFVSVFLLVCLHFSIMRTRYIMYGWCLHILLLGSLWNSRYLGLHLFTAVRFFTFHYYNSKGYVIAMSLYSLFPWVFLNILCHVFRLFSFWNCNLILPIC